jgi:hypothetical protein
MALAFRSEGRALRAAQQRRTRALTVPEPNVALLLGIVPTDGTRLPIVGSGEFGMSTFLGSSDARQLANICPVDYGD